MPDTLVDLNHPNELDAFWAANKANLHNVDWLTGAIKPQCRYIKKQGGGILQSQQNPSELAQWFVFLASKQPKSYMEIGVYECGTFYLTDSYLRAASPDTFMHSLAVDRRLEPGAFKDYQSKHDVVYMRTRSFRLPVLDFDVALIDALHSEAHARKDFEKVGSGAKVVGFHDILWKQQYNRCAKAYRDIATEIGCASFTIGPKEGTDGKTFGIGVLDIKVPV